MIQSLLLGSVRWFPFGAAAYLLLVFLLKRLGRELPFFMCYLAAALLTGVLRYFTLRIGQTSYFYTYWISDLFVSLAVFLAIYEVFLRRLFVGFQRTAAYRLVFPLAGAVLLTLTVATALAAPNKGAAFQMASRAFDFLRTALLIFFIGLMTLMGRRWSRYDLGITLGFGIQAAVALAAAAVRTRANYTPGFWDFVEVVVYDFSCLIWLFTFSRQERRERVAYPTEEALDQLQNARKWEIALKQWFKPKKPLL
jgi:hypothetical protein